MRFFDRLRASFARFMSGRYGADQLNMAILWTALIMSIIGSIARVSILTILADVLLVVMFIRLLPVNFLSSRSARSHCVGSPISSGSCASTPMMTSTP